MNVPGSGDSGLFWMQKSRGRVERYGQGKEFCRCLQNGDAAAGGW